MILLLSVLIVIQKVASGLEKLHGHDYIHRDIKCDNIFLNQENNGIVIGSHDYYIIIRLLIIIIR